MSCQVSMMTSGWDHQELHRGHSDGRGRAAGRLGGCVCVWYQALPPQALAIVDILLKDNGPELTLVSPITIGLPDQKPGLQCNSY